LCSAKPCRFGLRQGHAIVVDLMRARRSSSNLPRGLSWLLWLVLLLPLAQTAAQWHGYGHRAVAVAADAGETREADPQAPHATHCSLCLAAAHLCAGAVPAVAMGVGLPAGAQVWLSAAPSAGGQAALSLAYRSRAPPVVSC
jgi:hypothetical protein